MLANHVYAHLLLLLQPSVLWLSIVTFNNYVKPPSAKVNFARIWCITNPTPTSLGFLTLKRWHGKIWPQLRGLPGVADRATHLEGWPHLSCKRDQIKMRDYMDRRVTPPKRVTSPTWGPPPPCKQALKHSKINGLKPAMSWNYHITYKHKIKCARANGLNSSYRPEKDTTSLHVS